jgi:hypothetical protein
MDIKRKTCDIVPGKKLLFLDISSTTIDTLLPSLYQCVETRSLLTVASATSSAGRASSATFERPSANVSTLL